MTYLLFLRFIMKLQLCHAMLISEITLQIHTMPYLYPIYVPFTSSLTKPGGYTELHKYMTNTKP